MKQQPIDDDPLLTQAESAACINRSTRTIERLDKAGLLARVEVKDGARRPRIYYRQSDVLAHLSDAHDDQPGDDDEQAG